MAALPHPLVCIITDESLPLAALDALVAQACAARAADAPAPSDAPIVQLRAKSWTAAALYAAAERLRAITRERGRKLLVNDRVDVALAVGADGVHLPANGMASARARALLGDGRLLGRSVHSLAEIDRERDTRAVDYLQFGPVFATASKAEFGPPQGLDRLAEAVRRAQPLAVVAVGGMEPATARRVRETGAAGLAVIGAVVRASDRAAAVDELVSAWLPQPPAR